MSDGRTQRRPTTENEYCVSCSVTDQFHADLKDLCLREGIVLVALLYSTQHRSVQEVQLQVGESPYVNSHLNTISNMLLNFSIRYIQSIEPLST